MAQLKVAVRLARRVPLVDGDEAPVGRVRAEERADLRAALKGRRGQPAPPQLRQQLQARGPRAQHTEGAGGRRLGCCAPREHRQRRQRHHDRCRRRHEKRLWDLELSGHGGRRRLSDTTAR